MHFVVQCRSEPRRGEIPVRFGWPGRMREVDEVLDCWEGEEHRDFRLRATDGSIYILRHDLRGACWHIHFFRQGPE